MSISSSYKRYLRIIDAVVDEVAEELAENSEHYSCQKGCSHCCHMYVETTWDEAIALAQWVQTQEEPMRSDYVERVHSAAEERAEFFRKRNFTKRFAAPTSYHKDLPDEINREYFYSASRPCPMLENDACTAYEARPSACRLHVVTSDPILCSRDTADDADVEIPEEFDKKRERIEAIAEEYLEDTRWGELSIMLSHALRSVNSEQVNPQLQEASPQLQANGE